MLGAIKESRYRIAGRNGWAAVVALAALLFQAFAGAEDSSTGIVEWTFPRTSGCHEGIPFSDGITGVLVWGGGDTVNVTVGRGDLWDHRGGYPWTAEQSYTNIVAAVRDGDESRLVAMFRKEAVAGEPRNPYMLPFGRVVVRIPGKTLSRGTLDPFTGIGTVEFAEGGRLELVMPRESRCFAMRFPTGLKREVMVRSCMEFPAAANALAPVGFKPAVKRADGFDWQLPADAPASLDFVDAGDLLTVSTRRAERTTPSAVIGSKVGFEKLRGQSLAQWSEFWKRGARVKVPDPTVQRLFDYGMYRFGAMTDPDGIPAGLQGQWLEDDKLVPWNGDYHFNINVQECYSPAYRGGHFEHLKPLFRMILAWRPHLRENARLFAGIEDGYVLPHSVDDRGVCIGGFWTGTIDHASTAWVAAMMYRYVRYSGDVGFLRSDAYDFMRGAMNVYLTMFVERDGKLELPLGPSPEWGGDSFRDSVGRNPSFQLAAAHRLARDLIDAARTLGESPDPRWLDVEKRLPTYTHGNGGIMLFEGVPFMRSHRHHSHLAGLYPFDVIDLSDLKTRVDAFEAYNRFVWCGTGEWSGWCVPWAAILNVHCGNDERAVDLLHAWDRYFCNPGHGSRHNPYLPGFSVMGACYADQKGDAPGNEIMQMDGQCAAATAVMELLVHEVNGKVEYFRGCPESWTDVSFENLALSDGTRVSARRLNGKVTVVPSVRR